MLRSALQRRSLSAISRYFMTSLLWTVTCLSLLGHAKVLVHLNLKSNVKVSLKIFLIS